MKLNVFHASGCTRTIPANLADEKHHSPPISADSGSKFCAGKEIVSNYLIEPSFTYRRSSEGNVSSVN